MPGIFGCINRNRAPVSNTIAYAMSDSLMHEKWFICDWILNECLLGIVELKTASNINIFDEEKLSLMGVFKGNIYNKDELLKIFDVGLKASSLNDIQLIMYLYNKSDVDFLKYINGQFVFALFDRTRKKIVVAHDRYGYYPLFYFFNDKKFIFASEAKAILVEPTLYSKIEEAAIPEFFSFSHLVGDKTFFKQIKYLQPGTILIYDKLKDDLIKHQYFDFVPSQDRILDLNELLESFKEIMKKAIDRTIQNKKKIGIFLSGGLDSRLITAFASETSVEVVTLTLVQRIVQIGI